MQLYKGATALVLAASLGACSTIVTGTEQQISIATNPADATCTVDQGEARIGTYSTPPRTFTVDKTRDDLIVNCSKAGYADVQQINESGLEPWVFGNIIIGGVIGLVVDLVSGGHNKYETQMNITLPESSGGAPPVKKAPSVGGTEDTAKTS